MQQVELPGGEVADTERAHLARRPQRAETTAREAKETGARTSWRDVGSRKEDGIRKEFMRIPSFLGQPELPAPKTLRHTFATSLQDANVDPLIRNELMGHAPGSVSLGGRSLGMTAIYRGLVAEALGLIDVAQADVWVVAGGKRGPFAESSRIPRDTRDAIQAPWGVASVNGWARISAGM